ncbi:hypothetical protein SCHIN_v1c10680 [Spiroplasma chinense]|uniref:Lipoprotein n=1 Tax=Spiroplasma chinense TaxID=216932 RepID=A0A5B9Y5E1_9MOLU|nr:hypothetical protein [Spiroplasma chinense]QEH62261.1 hypothetical protein SCHIN_v1c10680 [Spiroplasma chinense]
MKKMLSILVSLSMTSGIVTQVISCGTPNNETSKTINTTDGLILTSYNSVSNAKETYENAYLKWTTFTPSVGSYIKSYMLTNYTVKANKEKVANKTVELSDVKEEIFDIFNSNLRVYGFLDSDSNFNINDFDFTEFTLVGDLESLYNGPGSEADYSYLKFKVNINFKGSDKTFTVKGGITDWNFDPIKDLDANNFKSIIDKVVEAGYITDWTYGTGAPINQSVFITLDFNGAKKDPNNWSCLELLDEDKNGCDWDEDQWISTETVKKLNTDFISSRLRTAGIIDEKLSLNYNFLELDVASAMSSWNTGGKPTLSNDGEKIWFEKKYDFGVHSVLFKSYFYWPNVEDYRLETWGSYLKSNIIY